MMLQSESAIFAEADARVFRMLMSANRTQRRLMAADRTIASAYHRVATLRNLKQARASREHANSERELAKELGGTKISAAWGRTFLVKMPQPERARSARPNTSYARTSVSRRTLRAYKTPLIDKRGRVAIFMNIKYRGFKSKGWRPGLAADHIEYIMREAALEKADAQREMPISNMGQTTEEIMACWRALEAVEEGYRANAIVQHRIVWNLPHNLDADQRRALVEEFCERTLGRLGLPYAAATHTPDGAGDERNYHAHICFSTRPCERTGSFAWAISEEKVNGLTDPAGLRLMRALGAAHMNRACRAAGLSDLFTHQTYSDRGFDARRQERVGPEAMAAHDRGEVVNVIARNAAIVEQNEASIARQQVEQRLDANLHIQRLLVFEQKQASRRKVIRLQLASANTVSSLAGRVAKAVRNSRLADRQQPSIAQAIRIKEQAAILGTMSGPPRRHRSLQASPLVLQKLAAGIVDGSRVTKPTQDVAAMLRSLSELATRVGGIRTKLTKIPARVNRLGRNDTSTATRLAAASTGAFMRIQSLNAAMMSAKRLRSDWTATQNRIDADRAADLDARRKSVRDAIMSADGLNCTIADGQIRYRLRALNDDDRNAFLSLDQAIQRDLLLERYAADQRAEKEALERKAAQKAAQAAASEKALQVAEACRIILQARAKPYRRDSQMIQPDWNNLSAKERTLVKAVGISNPELKDALIRRVKADKKIEEAALVMQQASQIRSDAKPAEPISARSIPIAEVHGQGDASAGNVSPSIRPHSNDQIAGKLNNLVILDVWVGPANAEGFTLSKQSLIDTGLTAAELNLPEVQFALEAIHNDQIDRLEPVLDDLEPTPQFQVRQGVVALDDRFSRTLQADVDRWAADQRFQAFVKDVWGHVKLDAASPVQSADAGTDHGTSVAIQRRDAQTDLWSQAASVRRNAMEGWQIVERSDGVGGARPGRRLVGPGHPEPFEDKIPDSADRRVPRFHPGISQGGGISD